VPFKIISGATDGVSQPQVKAQQQVRASQSSHTLRAHLLLNSERLK